MGEAPRRAIYASSLRGDRLDQAFTLPTRSLTGQHVISSDGYGASMAFSRRSPAGSSPSHAGHVSGV